MTHVDTDRQPDLDPDDIAPGDERSEDVAIGRGVRGYLLGLGLAALLTAVSFLAPGANLVWGPSLPALLVTLAIAQMGVHLVFFLHITTGPDSTNNVLALAFGVLIVGLILGGSIWIMAHLSQHMPTMGEVMRMQR